MKLRKIISLVIVAVCLVSAGGGSILGSIDTDGLTYDNVTVFAKKKKKKTKTEETAAGAEEESGSSKDKSKDCTSILPKSWCSEGEDGKSLKSLLNVILNVITAGVTVLGILGVTIAGIQYATARDNEAQVVAAKKRILEVVIGLALWILFGVVLNYFVLGDWQSL